MFGLIPNLNKCEERNKGTEQGVESEGKRVYKCYLVLTAAGSVEHETGMFLYGFDENRPPCTSSAVPV